MKKIIEHALIVLEKQDDWMIKDDITIAVREVFPKADMRPVFTHFRSRANIGYEKGKFRYYPPNELTNKVQECLNRGDDW
jgi:hypothetical protein